MDARVVVAIIIRFRLDESIVLLHHFSMAHHHDAHRTNAATDVLAVSKSMATKSCIVVRRK